MKRWITSNVCAAVVSALHAISTTACITVVALGAIALFTSPTTAQLVELRVDGDDGGDAYWVQDGTADGSGWSVSAFKYLQDALAEADNLFNSDPPGATAVHIWVAATGSGNPYVPNVDSQNPGGLLDQELTFKLRANVEILGGFAGFETDEEDRDPYMNETVLSGDIGSGLNSTSVVRAVSEAQQPFIDDSAIIDGFTIRDGVAHSSGDDWGRRGAGIYIENAIPIVRGCTFVNNQAQLRGGAIYAEHSHEDADPVTIRNCVFEQNSSAVAGGAVALGGGDTVIVNCTFLENTAQAGGGVHANNESTVSNQQLDIANCVFRNNEATEVDGGAVNLLNWYDLHITNCVIVENTAATKGGGVHVLQGEMLVVNSTIAQNACGDTGAGGGLTHKGAMTVLNSIVWGNSSNGSSNLFGDQILAEDFQHSVFEYSCITNDPPGVPVVGIGNINEDPIFRNVGAGDYRLTCGSPAMEAGLNAYVPADDHDVLEGNNPNAEAPDADLMPRIVDACGDEIATVDMGGYEYFARGDVCPADLDGSGAVDGADLAIVLGNWTQSGECADCNNCVGDINGDCRVDGADLALVLSNWGPCPTACNCGGESAGGGGESSSSQSMSGPDLFYEWLLEASLADIFEWFYETYGE